MMLAEVSTIILIAVMLVSLAASIVLAPKVKTAKSGGPTTLTDRGATIPLVIGVRSVGPLFGWAGARHSAGTPATFYEAGWHPLCTGPVYRLRKIMRNGKVIWQGPIDASIAPSGTKIATTNSGAFTIYWGEGDQPINTYIAEAQRVGVLSRWPFTCFVVWENFKLGPAPVWPQLEYEVEVRPQSSVLKKSSAWFPSTKTAGTILYPVTSVTNGIGGTAKIVVIGNAKKVFFPGSFLKLSANGPADGDYEVLSSSVESAIVQDPDTAMYGPTTVTKIILASTLAAASEFGTVQAYTELQDDGANHAHVLAQLLFSPMPWGAGLDVDRFDIESLERLGQICESERLLGSVVAKDGVTYLSLIQNILSELGVFLSLDPLTGKFRFIALRWDPAAIPAHLGGALLLSPKPEATSLLGPQPQNRVEFLFDDRELNYKPNPVAVGDPAAQSSESRVKTEKISITTVVDMASARRIADRKAQEGLSGNASITVYAGRGARDIVPGDRFTVEGQSGRWRATEVQPEVDAAKTRVALLADHYSSGPGSEQDSSPTSGGTVLDLPEADLMDLPVELPPFAGTKGKIEFLFPRARAKAQISSAALLLSSDGSSYVFKGDLKDISTGGKLLSAMTANAWDDIVVESGPSVVLYGPDAGIIEDLLSSPSLWYSGRQWCVIGSEICFLRGVTPLGNSHYRLDGLIRARLGTTLAAHAVGDAVAIFNPDFVSRWSDAIFSPGSSRYAKIIPAIDDDAVDVSDVTVLTVPVAGLAVAPYAPRNVNVSPRFDRGYRTGEAIALSWSYHSLSVALTGAGHQPSGAAYSPAPPEGTFTVVFKNTSNVVKKTVTGLTSPSYTLTNGDLVSAFGSEPSSFRVEVSHVLSGFTSTAPFVTITKVT